MDISIILDWLAAKKDSIASLEVVFTIITTVIAGIWAWITWRKSRSDSDRPTPLPSTTTQKSITLTASDGSTVSGNHIGDKHYHGFSIEEVEKIVESVTKTLKSQFESVIEDKDQIIRSLHEATKALPAQPTSSKNIQEALAALAKGDTREAETIFEEVATEARRAGKEANLKEAEALRHLGALSYLHDTEKAFNAYKRSTELDPENWEGWNMLGILYKRIGELENAEKVFITVLKLTDRREIPAIVYTNLGNIYQIRGELDKAVDYYQQALEIDRLLDNQKGIASTYGNLGLVYQTRGELDKAVDYHNKALAINQLLDNQEGIASNYSNLGLVYRIRGELDKAVDYHNKALVIHRTLGKKEGIASTYGNLGLVYQTRGELDKAVDYHNKALAINQLLNNQEGITGNYGNLGLIYQTRSEFDKAVDYHNKALAINQLLGRKEGIAINYANLGIIHETWGEFDKAVEYWEKSLLLFQEIGTKDEVALLQSWLDELK